MPETQSGPVAHGGYPPTAPLRGAVPGWLPRDWLASVSTPDAARAALRAEAETSVLDPVGMRRLWVRELYLALALGILVLAVVASVQFVRNDELPWWWFPLLLLIWPMQVSQIWLRSLCRAIPGRADLPRPGMARLRWYRQLRREHVVVRPPAAWPAGSEAYAVLAGAASVESVAPTWLFERIGMSPDVGSQWVTVLTYPGWLTGGGRTLGIERLPESHLLVTDAGRERLDRERARFEALAAR